MTDNFIEFEIDPSGSSDDCGCCEEGCPLPEKCVCGDCQSEKLSMDADEEEFLKGVQEGSYFAGLASVLFAAGLSEESVIKFIISKMDDEFAYKVALLNADVLVKTNKADRNDKEKNIL